MDIRERRNQWSQEDWKRDIARYEHYRASLIKMAGNPYAIEYCEIMRKRCNDIAERYPSAKLDRFE